MITTENLPIEFLGHYKVGPQTLDVFHEWNVELALAAFAAKHSNDEPVTMFVFHCGDTTRVMRAEFDNGPWKAAIFGMVRAACANPALKVDMVGFISETWITTTKSGSFDPRVEVRNTPGREDGLSCASYAREGRQARVTRWVVRLKKDPRKNIVLARDDVDPSEMYGRGVNFFDEERHVDEDKLRRGRAE